jgi:hypothetical protein
MDNLIEFIEARLDEARAFTSPNDVKGRAAIDARSAILRVHRIRSDLSPYEASYGDHSFGCVVCHEFDGIIMGAGYCVTIRALALFDRDHPDYRQAWEIADYELAKDA